MEGSYPATDGSRLPSTMLNIRLRRWEGRKISSPSMRVQNLIRSGSLKAYNPTSYIPAGDTQGV